LLVEDLVDTIQVAVEVLVVIENLITLVLQVLTQQVL
jgi:hypothetical protein